MAYFMGIFAGGPNPAAAIINDGQLVAFAEEERFNRIKMAPHHLPLGSMDYCLQAAGVELQQVKEVGFGWDCPRYIRETALYFEDLEDEFPVEDNEYNQLFETRLRCDFSPVCIEADLISNLAKLDHQLEQEKLTYYPHHLCHAASAFYPSGFEEAVVLTVDGSGEEFATVVWHAKGDGIRAVKEFKLPHTIGGVYATFTEFLGFKPNEEEGKVMGLAPYGEFSQSMQDKLDSIIPFHPETGNYTVNPYMRYLGPRSEGRIFTDKFVEIFGSPKKRSETLGQRHKDLAYNLQWRIEKIVCLLALDAINATGCPNVCLAGGVAMNCKMNGAIGMLDEVAELFVQP
jgi:carbamoyltransferase